MQFVGQTATNQKARWYLHLAVVDDGHEDDGSAMSQVNFFGRHSGDLIGGRSRRDIRERQSVTVDGAVVQTSPQAGLTALGCIGRSYKETDSAPMLGQKVSIGYLVE